MDWRKWTPRSVSKPGLFCTYCGNPADSSDHTPPRCLLPRKLPNQIQAMTVPACTECNSSYASDEMRVAAVVSTVSCQEWDRKEVAEGGRIHSALQSDQALNEFISSRLGTDGSFRADSAVTKVLSRVAKKTAVGLMLHEFGRTVSLAELSVIAVDQLRDNHPLASIELARHDHSLWAEVTATGRVLERHVVAWNGQRPPNMPEFRAYFPGFFEYLFIRRTNDRLLAAMKIHETLVVSIECPWPNRSGPRRGGRQRGALQKGRQGVA